MRNWWGTDVLPFVRRTWQAWAVAGWIDRDLAEPSLDFDHSTLSQFRRYVVGQCALFWPKIQSKKCSSCSSAWFHQIEQRAFNHLQNNLQIGYHLHSPVEMVISHGSPAHSWQWVVPKFTQNTRKSLRKQRKPKYSGIFRFWEHKHIRLYSCTTPYETCCW